VKTEGAIKNEQYRDTGNIGHKTQNEDKNYKEQKTQLRISFTTSFNKDID